MMKTLVLLLFLYPVCGFTQTNLQLLSRKSHRVLAYPISAAKTVLYLEKDSIDIDAFLYQPPEAIFPADSIDESRLANGCHVLFTVEDNRFVVRLTVVSGIRLTTVNNNHRLQLVITHRNGAVVPDAGVWVNNVQAHYQARTQSYLVKQTHPDEALVKVFTPTDTLFYTLSIEHEPHEPVSLQRWRNFKKTTMGRILCWLPVSIGHLFSRPTHHYRFTGTGASGLVLFNQPQYRPADTVKLKAYLYNKKQQPYSQAADIYLQYYARGKAWKIFLQHLQPAAPGSYIYQFPLSDTLPSDLQYQLVFYNADKQQLLARSFKTADYLLPEITTSSFRADRRTYYPGDSLHLYASALDANGLPLLDASARLLITTSSIRNFYQDSLYVPDTLFVTEQPLAAEGDTKFDFTTARLPQADLDFTALLQLKNGNNELLRKTVDIHYRVAEKQLTAYAEKDSIIAEYRENGQPVTARGIMHRAGDQLPAVAVQYPLKIKIDPLVSSYQFHLLRDGQLCDTVSPLLPYNCDLRFNPLSHGDTLGFVLDNPFTIPVSFTVFKGNKIIAGGRSSDAHIQWSTINPHKGQAWRVSWQYRWKGEEKSNEENIAVLYKLLQLHIDANNKVFPGLQDTITLQATYYKEKPAANVNLTAMAYNNQFSNNTQVPDPPYFTRYHLKASIKRGSFEADEESGNSRRFPLGMHRRWFGLMGIDTMLYYQVHFPGARVMDVVTPIQSMLPQVSVHVVNNGERQEIYLLYINLQLVYYNGVTEKMAEAWHTAAGYTKFGIRLRDQFIEVDSVYLQRSYKHDLFIDLAQLPAHTTITPLKAELTQAERRLLENSLWQLADNTKTNNGYVWQPGRLVHLSGNRIHLAGPFNSDSLQFFAPGSFDIRFLFEPGYQYNISPKVVRLEKTPVFPGINPVKLAPVYAPSWKLGDTLIDPPPIFYPQPPKHWPYLPSNDIPRTRNTTTGSLYFTVAPGTHLLYVILYPDQLPDNKLVLNGGFRHIPNLAQGSYTLLLVNRDMQTAALHHLRVLPAQTCCVHTANTAYLAHHPLLDTWLQEAAQPDLPGTFTHHQAPAELLPPYPSGKASITGKVIDKNGLNGIPGAYVVIKESRTSSVTGTDGSFTIPGIKPGHCTLVVSAIGYMQQEITIAVPGYGTANALIPLVIGNQALEEVVVTGYSAVRRKSLTGAISIVSANNAPEGSVAGVSVNKPADNRISLRGLTNSPDAPAPLYVIDGILYEAMPGNITPAMMASISIVSQPEAAALYGSRGANGVVVITTSLKAHRNQFRDYAFWEPQLFTDETGKVKFAVQYPDNITGWEAYVLGMDRRGRIGKARLFIQSYKPLTALLGVPQFLVTGDSAVITGRVMNYTADNYPLQTSFRVNGQAAATQPGNSNAKTSLLVQQAMTADREDSVDAAFQLTTSTGFTDAEEKKIPVFPAGTLETKGLFQLFSKDTSIGYRLQPGSESIECFAQNNTFDLLLNELAHLKKYPYFCMEQTASKLRGLLLEKQIREKQGQRFEEDKSITLLLNKLLKAQLYNGGWSWWENGAANVYVSNYVIRALLPLRTRALTETSIRNGLLYLQNELPALTRAERLHTLLTLSEAGHLVNYAEWLSQLPFDSLTIPEQWEYVKIQQQQNTEHQAQLSQLLNKAIPGVPGSLHWGENNYRWYSDANATTVLAFEVLQKEKNTQQELQGMVQYFLEQRSTGYWMNTVTSASIVAALLPYTLFRNQAFEQPAVLHITGDTSFTIQQYPFQLTLRNSTLQHFNIQKTGGGLTYFTLYQQHRNTQPQAVDSLFMVRTGFEKNSDTLTRLRAGESVKLVVDITALKEADYVMIEVPIPGGCVYGAKEQNNYAVHKEFLKNKTLLFAEKLSKGLHHFEINLEARYSGSFTLNPAKVSLMHFPVFYGRNAVKKIMIQ